jgi:hypothetical protein
MARWGGSLVSLLSEQHLFQQEIKRVTGFGKGFISQSVSYTLDVWRYPLTKDTLHRIYHQVDLLPQKTNLRALQNVVIRNFSYRKRGGAIFDHKSGEDVHLWLFERIHAGCVALTHLAWSLVPLLDEPLPTSVKAFSTQTPCSRLMICGVPFRSWFRDKTRTVQLFLERMEWNLETYHRRVIRKPVVREPLEAAKLVLSDLATYLGETNDQKSKRMENYASGNVSMEGVIGVWAYLSGNNEKKECGIKT